MDAAVAKTEEKVGYEGRGERRGRSCSYAVMQGTVLQASWPSPDCVMLQG